MSTQLSHVVIARAVAQVVALSPLRVPIAAVQVKFVAFVKACSARWSRQALAVVAVAWAKLS